MRASRLSGLYIVTPEPTLVACENLTLLQSKVTSALQGGATVLQYRDKCSDPESKYRIALSLKQVCDQFQAVFIVNDDVDLAKKVSAHGVHLGEADTSLRVARGILGEQAIIGISCYNRLELALKAEASGADYVAFGRFFCSATKPEAIQANLDLLREAKRNLNIPVAAIGGITAHNASELLLAGADMLAVIDGVFGQENVKAAAEKLCSCFALPQT